MRKNEAICTFQRVFELEGAKISFWDRHFRIPHSFLHKNGFPLFILFNIYVFTINFSSGTSLNKNCVTFILYVSNY